MSRHLDSYTKNTNGLNHGPVWKTQSFLLSEICMVILWQDCYGKGNLRRSYWNMAGRKFQIGNVSLFIVKKDYSCLCMWTTKLAGKKQNIDPMWKILMQYADLGDTNEDQPSKTKDLSAQGNLWHSVMLSTRKKNQTKAPPSTIVLSCFIFIMCLRMSDFSVNSYVVCVWGQWSRD